MRWKNQDSSDERRVRIMDHLEVMPVSSRVVCLNAPHLKSLCVFEALSRTLGCYYNHHHPQVQPHVLLLPRIGKERVGDGKS